jgi:hypothetical protein
MAIVFSDPNGESVSTSNTNSYAGVAFTPASGDLLICAVMASGTVAAGSMSGTWTWNKLTSFTFNSGSDTVYIFWAAATAATSTTCTFDCTGDNATGCIIIPVRISGAEGQTQPYIRQMNTNTGTTANPSVTLAQACDTNSGVLIFAANGTNSAAQWSMTNYTEIYDNGYNTPPNGGTGQFRNSGETGSTLTITNASTTPWGMIAMEFYVAGAGPTETVAPINTMGFFGLQ